MRLPISRWNGAGCDLSMLRLNGFRLFLAAALFFALMISAAVFYRGAVKRPFTPVPGGHGCVNAGTDTRIDPFGLVCALQRRYSYKSSREPKLHTHETWAWGTHPFYLVYNRNLGGSNWLLIRVGWRYDRNWRGYIGPSLAWKKIPQPLLYY
jgi:hypothetical protein